MFHQKPISTLGNPTHPSFLNERQPSLDTYLSISNLINKHYLQQCRRGLLFSHFIKSIGAFSHMAQAHQNDLPFKTIEKFTKLTSEINIPSHKTRLHSQKSATGKEELPLRLSLSYILLILCLSESQVLKINYQRSRFKIQDSRQLKKLLP